MKVTVQINNELVEITLTPEQLAQIEEQKKPKKFEWVYGNCYFLTEAHVGRFSYSGTSPEYIEHGRYRKSKEAAQQSLLRNKRANRLEALAEQLGGLCEWKPLAANNTIAQDDKNKWFISTHTFFNPSAVYMTKECATEICRMLNEGEFSLDGELE